MLAPHAQCGLPTMAMFFLLQINVKHCVLARISLPNIMGLNLVFLVFMIDKLARSLKAMNHINDQHIYSHLYSQFDLIKLYSLLCHCHSLLAR